MTILLEVVKICNRYVSGEINAKAFESAFDSLVFRHEEELMAQELVSSHIEAIRTALECFEPLEANRAQDSSLINEEQLRKCVRESVLAMNSSPAILAYEDAITTQLNEKCTRRVLVYGAALMLVEFTFQQGGVGALHKHDDHDQVGYIVKGSFELTAGKDTRIVRSGDSYYAAKGVLHGVVALEDDSVIIDAFTPKRDDFLGL